MIFLQSMLASTFLQGISPAWATVVQDAAEAQSSSWRFLDLPPAWVLVMVILPAVFGVAFLAYWREPLSPRVRTILVGLRSLSLVALLLVIFRPVEVQSRENVEPATVLFLVDDSASMVNKDSYRADPELRESVIAQAQGDPAETERIELVQNALQGELPKRLEDRGYALRTFRFAENLAPLASPDGLNARGRSTHIGQAISGALGSMRGKHVTDVVVLSDGRNTGGSDPLDAAIAARASGASVHAVLVGDPNPEVNLTLELLDAPPNILQGDEVSIQLRVSGQGVENAETEVTLEELGPEGSGITPRAVDRAQVTWEGDSARVVLVAPGSSLVPDAPTRRFRARLDPLAKENLLEDNEVELLVQVTSAQMRVLYVEGFPRYEYRFLRELLRSGDERIQAQIFLMSATPDFPQDSSPGLPSLERIPTDRKTLLDNYDVIILGDLDPYRISADPARGEEFVASLREFVEKGGGLCVIGGEYENPRSVAGTDFASLLPVRLDTTGSFAPEQDTSRAYLPRLGTPDAPHEITRLHPELEVNRALWESEAGLPGFLWFAPTLGALPGSQVLLSHPEVTVGANREPAPLLVAGYYPEGRTLFLATDSTWRWRKRFRERYHHRFWHNALRWLALGRLRSQDRRHSLESMEPTYDLDESVVLEARVLDDDFGPTDAESIEILWQPPGQNAEPIRMTVIDGTPGHFRLRRNVERTGMYQAWIERDGSRLASAEFEVRMPSKETRDPSPDPAAMAALANVGGGRSVHLSSWDELVAEFPGDEERRLPVASDLTDTWDRWSTLLIALALFTLEWILRKRYELI